MSHRRTSNSTDDSYELRRRRREQALDHALHSERAEPSNDDSEVDVGDIEDDPYAAPELQRRRREQARVHARALAREAAWQDIYMPDEEGDDEIDDSSDEGHDSEHSSGGDDIIAQVIAMSNQLAQTLPSTEIRLRRGLVEDVARPLEQLRQGLDPTQHRELNEYLSERLHRDMEPRATSSMPSNATDSDDSDGSDSDHASDYEPYTMAFDPPTAAPTYQCDSSDSEQSSAANAGRYDPDSDSDTSTYDRELYGFTRANLSYEGAQLFGEQYLQRSDTREISRLRATGSGRIRSDPLEAASASRRSIGSARSFTHLRSSTAERSNAGSDDSNRQLTTIQSLPAPSLLEVLPRLGQPLAMGIRVADYAHHDPSFTEATQTIMQTMIPGMPSTARRAVGSFIDQFNAPRNRAATQFRFNNFEMLERDIATAGIDIFDVLALLGGFRRARAEDSRRTDNDLRAFEAEMASPLSDAVREDILSLNAMVLLQRATVDRPLSANIVEIPGVNLTLRSDLVHFITVYHSDPDSMWNDEYWEGLAVQGVNIDDIITMLQRENRQKYNGEPLRAAVTREDDEQLRGLLDARAEDDRASRGVSYHG